MLLNQAHVNDEKHGGKTLEELRAELAANTGENVVVRALRPLPGRGRSGPVETEARLSAASC